ncbi:MAG: hypothetical protein LBO71_03550, partial [Prevotellaceae bacterium]|nr:hypothetical protein [Prevotellaceae bacterium]
MLILLMTIGAAACSDNDNQHPELPGEPEAPVITFDQPSYTLPADTAATVSGVVTSASALVSVKYFLVSDTSEAALGERDTSATSYA